MDTCDYYVFLSTRGMCLVVRDPSFWNGARFVAQIRRFESSRGPLARRTPIVMVSDSEGESEWSFVIQSKVTAFLPQLISDDELIPLLTRIVDDGEADQVWWDTRLDGVLRFLELREKRQ